MASQPHEIPDMFVFLKTNTWSVSLHVFIKEPTAFSFHKDKVFKTMTAV